MRSSGSRGEGLESSFTRRAERAWYGRGVDVPNLARRGGAGNRGTGSWNAPPSLAASGNSTPAPTSPPAAPESAMLPRTTLLLALLLAPLPPGAPPAGPPGEAEPGCVAEPRGPAGDPLLQEVREHLDRGWGAPDREGRLTRYREAHRLAREAVERCPGSVEARWWLVASLGLRAQEEEGIGIRVRLGDRLHDEAETLLRIAPDHPGGHHAMGRLYASAQRLGRLARWAVAAMGGGDLLDEASWDRAEAHLRRAVALEPQAPHHRVELARILKDRGRKEEARRMARSALAASDDPPLAAWYKGWARELLAALS